MMGIHNKYGVRYDRTYMVLSAVIILKAGQRGENGKL